RDMNGQYSRFNYDQNGRIRAAWLPRDFFGQDSACADPYSGSLDYPLWGYTNYLIKTDTATCCNGLSHGVMENTDNGTWYGLLKAGLYHQDEPSCPGGSPIIAPGEDGRTADRKSDRQPLPL